MTTEAQCEANRANAQLSTGPTSDDGKAIASLNSVRHGLTAKTTLLPGEDPAEYQFLSTRMLGELEPLNTTETALVNELIDLTWRLQRASRFEARILSADALDTKALNNMSLHAALMKRQFSTTLKEFQQLHRIKLKARESDLDDAAALYRADKINQRPSTFEDFGFDFTLEDLEFNMRYEAHVTTAKDLFRRYKLQGGKENDLLFDAA